jgi:acetate kinase
VTADTILAVNAGSSSLKITLFDNDAALRRRAAATVERIGAQGPGLHAPTFDDALRRALEDVATAGAFTPLAVGHRIVHGGATHERPEPITPALLAELHRLAPIDPTHMPQALALVDAIGRRYPTLPQFACFDTSFHRTMPSVAQLYPLPRSTWNAGIRRYGFHGLSCESILDTLRVEDPGTAQGRLLIAHLGNGASVTAVRHGASVDTTMGFSPTGGLMMGTRSGDLDPSVITYLARTGAYTADALEHLVTQEAGLLGVSEVSSDMRDVLSRTDSRQAQEAIDLYCYTARKHIGALAAVLNGVDTIVFTGGIGEHGSSIRAGICAGLGYIGVEVDPDANAANRPVISRPGMPVTVRVMQTDEDRVIARHVRQLIA